MSAVETPLPDGPEGKKELALKLLEQAKQLVPEIKRGEDAGVVTDLISEARRVGAEAKAEKDAQIEAEKKADIERIYASLDDSEKSTAGEIKSIAERMSNKVSAKTALDTALDEMSANKAKFIPNDRTKELFKGFDTKALNEGSGATGNFLVPPAYMQDMFAETRRQGNALRKYGWLTVHPVESNQVLIPRGSGAASVGWVSENTSKPSADQAYSQLTINIFTLAGISKVSLQLVQDSNPTAADLVARELGSLIGNAEEAAVINGTGTGQPKGIFNSTGLASAVTDTTATGATAAQSVIDAIINAIAAVASAYYEAPNGILMHPRRLASFMKAKDTASNYLFNPPGSFRSPGGVGDTRGSLSAWDDANFGMLAGIPVGVSTNIPTTFNTNNDGVIVGNWQEAHWFQRQELTLDSSDVAGTAFESNQVWFRLEERAGFTAERYAAAFATITGNGTFWQS